MKRSIGSIVLFIAITMLALTYAISLSLRKSSIIPENLDARNHPGFFDYRGAINVQSSLSHGFLTPIEAIRAAQESRLDFLIFNELNRFFSAENNEGWQRQLLVISGGKYSYLESRILSIDPDRLKTVESLGQAQTTIADFLSRIGSPSPDDHDSLILAQSSREGTDWAGAYPDGLSGLEVLNIRQVIGRTWRDSKLSFLWSLLIYGFNSDIALVRLFADLDTSFETWDRASQERTIFGILGTDVGTPTDIVGVSVNAPSYESLFALASNHVLLRSELTGEYTSDRRKIISALQQGQSYFAIDALGQTKGFAAWFETQGELYSLGSRVRLEDSGRLMVRLPRKPSVPFETALLKDGVSIMTSNSTETEFRIRQPGVYRIVVRLFVSLSLFDGGRWIPWIMTNPITAVTPLEQKHSSQKLRKAK